MSFRYMRVFVIFDLPTLSVKERREYRKFRQYLLKSGFIMMQESVYSKLCLNGTAAKTISENVKKHKPCNGIVELLTVTEKQYASIDYVVGAPSLEYVATTDKVVVL